MWVEWQSAFCGGKPSESESEASLLPRQIKNPTIRVFFLYDKGQGGSRRLAIT